MLTNSSSCLVVHGGAGTITNQTLSQAKEEKIRSALSQSLRAGFDLLKNGFNSLDAIEVAIKVLEDSPLFNAGHGAALNQRGGIDLDASIMCGENKQAGAVAGVRLVKNPISLARAVMEKSPHVLLIGQGADDFAFDLGLKVVKPEYFWTEEQLEQLQLEMLAEQDKNNGQDSHESPIPKLATKFGTVGAVAKDKNGNLAAGTSTGGIPNRQIGRVGDSPIIGAGTYADNKGAAVSATGYGEYFIRLVVAHEINSLIKLKGLTVKEAAESVIYEQLKEIGGLGGVIALDAHGNFAMPFNTTAMYRGFIGEDGEPHVLIFQDEKC